MLELVDALYPGRGGIARMSRECGIDDSYLRRLTYSPSSRGSKGLGEDTIDTLERHYRLPRGWFDMPLGSAPADAIDRDAPHIAPFESPEISPSDNSFRIAQEPESTMWQYRRVWPFPDVDPARWDALSAGHQRAVQARINEVILACESGLIEPLPDTPRSKRSA
ncbi:MAG: hypothetical protein KDH20_15830 [Rhodocyclaceae bacterium]|nr:hypothetical protein [Rhodocyclaceae bacterium]